MKHTIAKANQVLALFITDVALTAQKGADEKTSPVMREILFKGLVYSTALASAAQAVLLTPTCKTAASKFIEQISVTQRYRDGLWGHRTTPDYSCVLEGTSP